MTGNATPETHNALVPPLNSGGEKSVAPKKNGGKRPGAGRKPGSRDVATVQQRGTLADLAREHTPAALDTLVHVATNSESDAARVSAAVAILDRGYGKPAQSMELSGKDGGPVKLEHLIAASMTKPKNES